MTEQPRKPTLAEMQALTARIVDRCTDRHGRLCGTFVRLEPEDVRLLLAVDATLARLLCVQDEARKLLAKVCVGGRAA